MNLETAVGNGMEMSRAVMYWMNRVGEIACRTKASELFPKVGRAFSLPTRSLAGAFSGLRLTAILMKQLQKLGRILLGILKEIGDENAYHRHLTAHGVKHSGEEWRRFSEHRMKEKYANAKCC